MSESIIFKIKILTEKGRVEKGEARREEGAEGEGDGEDRGAPPSTLPLPVGEGEGEGGGTPHTTSGRNLFIYSYIVCLSVTAPGL